MLDYYRSGDGRAFLQRQALVLVASGIALCALFDDGRLDLASARWFYDDALRAFPLVDQWLLKDVLHDAARVVSAAAALLLVVLSAAAWAAPAASRIHRYRQELLFAAGASLVAAATVGALKHFSAHACPWSLDLFGGTATSHPLFSPRAAARSVSGCFPAAHPLSGYAWLAAGFSLYPLAPSLARRWWSVALVLGTLFGAVQIARGAHFPSHVLWSAWVCWAVDVGLLTTAVWSTSLAAAARPAPLAATVQHSGPP